MRRLIPICWIAAGALACSACSRSAAKPSVSLDVTRVAGSAEMDVKANVVGPSEGIQFRFFTDDGACNPQLSRAPNSRCAPAPGARTVKIQVELLRGTEVVGRAESSVYDVASRAPEAQEAEPPASPPPAPEPVAAAAVEPPRAAQPTPARAAGGDPDIQILTVPRYDAMGGPDTRDDIAGRVSGVPDPRVFKVVIYAHTDLWYVQPLLSAVIDVDRRGNWSTWTHRGSQYAALLVRSSYSPPPQMGQPPQEGGEVLAVAVVDGRKR